MEDQKIEKPLMAQEVELDSQEAKDEKFLRSGDNLADVQQDKPGARLSCPDESRDAEVNFTISPLRSLEEPGTEGACDSGEGLAVVSNVYGIASVEESSENVCVNPVLLETTHGGLPIACEEAMIAGEEVPVTEGNEEEQLTSILKKALHDDAKKETQDISGSGTEFNEQCDDIHGRASCDAFGSINQQNAGSRGEEEGSILAEGKELGTLVLGTTPETAVPLEIIASDVNEEQRHPQSSGKKESDKQWNVSLADDNGKQDTCKSLDQDAKQVLGNALKVSEKERLVLLASDEQDLPKSKEAFSTDENRMSIPENSFLPPEGAELVPERHVEGGGSGGKSDGSEARKDAATSVSEIQEQVCKEACSPVHTLEDGEVSKVASSKEAECGFEDESSNTAASDPIEGIQGAEILESVHQQVSDFESLPQQDLNITDVNEIDVVEAVEHACKEACSPVPIHATELSEVSKVASSKEAESGIEDESPNTAASDPTEVIEGAELFESVQEQVSDFESLPQQDLSVTDINEIDVVEVVENIQEKECKTATGRALCMPLNQSTRPKQETDAISITLDAPTEVIEGAEIFESAHQKESDFINSTEKKKVEIAEISKNIQEKECKTVNNKAPSLPLKQSTTPEEETDAVNRKQEVAVPVEELQVLQVSCPGEKDLGPKIDEKIENGEYSLRVEPKVLAQPRNSLASSEEQWQQGFSHEKDGGSSMDSTAGSGWKLRETEGQTVIEDVNSSGSEDSASSPAHNQPPPQQRKKRIDLHHQFVREIVKIQHDREQYERQIHAQHASSSSAHQVAKAGEIQEQKSSPAEKRQPRKEPEKVISHRRQSERLQDKQVKELQTHDARSKKSMAPQAKSGSSLSRGLVHEGNRHGQPDFSEAEELMEENQQGKFGRSKQHRFMPIYRPPNARDSPAAAPDEINNTGDSDFSYRQSASFILNSSPESSTGSASDSHFPVMGSTKGVKDKGTLTVVKSSSGERYVHYIESQTEQSTPEGMGIKVTFDTEKRQRRIEFSGPGGLGHSGRQQKRGEQMSSLSHDFGHGSSKRNDSDPVDLGHSGRQRKRGEQMSSLSHDFGHGSSKGNDSDPVELGHSGRQRKRGEQMSSLSHDFGHGSSKGNDSDPVDLGHSGRQRNRGEQMSFLSHDFSHGSSKGNDSRMGFGLAKGHQQAVQADSGPVLQHSSFQIPSSLAAHSSPPFNQGKATSGERLSSSFTGKAKFTERGPSPQHSFPLISDAASAPMQFVVVTPDGFRSSHNGKHAFSEQADMGRMMQNTYSWSPEAVSVPMHFRGTSAESLHNTVGGKWMSAEQSGGGFMMHNASFQSPGTASVPIQFWAPASEWPPSSVKRKGKSSEQVGNEPVSQYSSPQIPGGTIQFKAPSAERIRSSMNGKLKTTAAVDRGKEKRQSKTKNRNQDHSTPVKDSESPKSQLSSHTQLASQISQGVNEREIQSLYQSSFQNQVKDEEKLETERGPMSLDMSKGTAQITHPQLSPLSVEEGTVRTSRLLGKWGDIVDDSPDAYEYLQVKVEENSETDGGQGLEFSASSYKYGGPSSTDFSGATGLKIEQPTSKPLSSKSIRMKKQDGGDSDRHQKIKLSGEEVQNSPGCSADETPVRRSVWDRLGPQNFSGASILGPPPKAFGERDLSRGLDDFFSSKSVDVNMSSSFGSGGNSASGFHGSSQASHGEHEFSVLQDSQTDFDLDTNSDGEPTEVVVQAYKDAKQKRSKRELYVPRRGFPGF